MKNFKFIFLVIILLTSSVYSQNQSNSLKVSGLKDSVKIIRDARSIPYIEAKNEEDLYFAQGFTTASDRLWQMDLLRRVARGQTAEIFGKTTLEEDKRWRKFGFSKVVEENFASSSKEMKIVLESYAKGVNAYISSLDAKSFPIEFQILQYKPSEWLPTDTLIIGKILSDALSTTWQYDLLRQNISNLPPDKQKSLLDVITPDDVILFGRDVKPGKVSKKFSEFDSKSINIAFIAKEENLRKSSLERIGLYAEHLAASNNWVISGKRTADGKPILANDPHLRPGAPGIWYITHLSAPNLRVSGVTFPGTPGVVLGHNEYLAWGATNVGPDVQDLYLETFNQAGEYKTPNGWQKPKIRIEEIKVRRNPLKPETEITKLEVLETRNGVLFTEETDKKYALRWTAFNPQNSEFEAFLQINKAKNWNEFKNALRAYGGAMQNFVYADVNGNIGWYAAAKIPVRRKGSGALPYDGTTSDGDWVSTIPFEELPNLYNPQENFIVTANQRIVGSDYKYFDIMTRNAAAPWRARRIYELIKNNPKISVEDVAQIQFDSYNKPLHDLAKWIITNQAATSQTMEIIKSWDGKMKADSQAAFAVNEINKCISSKIEDEEAKKIPIGLIRERSIGKPFFDKNQLWLPKNFKSYSEFVLSCDKEWQEKSKQSNQPVIYKNWGDIFKATFPHPLSAAPLIGIQFATPNQGIDGSGNSPNVGSSVSMRHIATPGNWDNSRLVIPLGQSGNPRSEFYKDQFESWKTGLSVRVPFSDKAIEASAKTTLIIAPAN